MTRPAPTARGLLVGLASLALTSAFLAPVATPAQAEPAQQTQQRFNTEKVPTAVGYGGAVSSVDPEATAAGLKVLRQGGNAVDAAVATAAVLGVTEPYSAGIGGGGYFVYYDAKSKRVQTIDGRETAPRGIKAADFVDAAGKALPFNDLVTSGRSVGVPGTPATWDDALRRWGRNSLAQNLAPAIDVAWNGFEVDATFRSQTEQNQTRFAQIPSTAALYLPNGQLPAVGSVFRNRALARTYAQLARRGVDEFYDGAIGRDIVATVQNPPKTATATLPVYPGTMTMADLRSYRALKQQPTKVDYRGLQVYGMAPSSSGGTTVGEALNILENYRLRGNTKANTEQALHYYLDASALAFADRGKYVGDPAFVDVPTKKLLSQRFADNRACKIDDRTALPTPTAPGDVNATGCTPAPAVSGRDNGKSTTHLVSSDRWGNVVSYTLTIEQTGGAGIVVPNRGFLLNNELTDFTYGTANDAAEANRVQPGKRPRSSMSPTIVLRNGRPVLAVGSPGGSTIITTVLQTLMNRIDLGMTLPQAVAAPRASQRNTAAVTAEPAFLDRYRAGLEARGYVLQSDGDSLTLNAEIGAVAALEFYRGGLVLAAAEPTRRGGGSAGVVKRIR